MVGQWAKWGRSQIILESVAPDTVLCLCLLTLRFELEYCYTPLLFHSICTWRCAPLIFDFWEEIIFMAF